MVTSRVSNNMGKFSWCDIRRRMLNPGWYLGYDQRNIKYEAIWIKTQRRLRKIKIVDLGWLIHKFTSSFFFPPLFLPFLYSYTVICLINIQVGKVERKKGGKEYLSKKDLTLRFSQNCLLTLWLQGVVVWRKVVDFCVILKKEPAYPQWAGWGSFTFYRPFDKSRR